MMEKWSIKSSSIESDAMIKRDKSSGKCRAFFMNPDSALIVEVGTR